MLFAALTFAAGAVALLLPCVSVVTMGAVVPVAGEATGEAAGCAGVVVSASSATTEREPEMMGSESVKATSMKSAAAMIVIFARIVCVPRGPKAVLDTELVKSAPASALPGCKSTATTSTMQDKIKSPYKK